MNVGVIDNAMRQDVLGPIGRQGAPGFAESLALAAQGDGAEAKEVEAQRQQVREVAQQFVATAFVMPLLAQARNDPFKSELFHGGFAEDAFGQQLDTLIADRLSQRLDLPLVDAIERFMFRGRGAGDTNTTGRQVNVDG